MLRRAGHVCPFQNETNRDKGLLTPIYFLEEDREGASAKGLAASTSEDGSVPK